MSIITIENCIVWMFISDVHIIWKLKSVWICFLSHIILVLAYALY